MKRWNGWGDIKKHKPLSNMAYNYLTNLLGKFDITPDIKQKILLKSIPNSKISNSFLNTNPLDRLLHARGQSFPDWISFKHGRIDSFPEAVAYPETQEDIKKIIHFAKYQEMSLIPYGGGTSVAGHINPNPDSRVITLNMQKMNSVLNINITNRLADIQAGANGLQIEHQLNSQGYTLGHFPQSFEYSTLGGWIATRSSGHQSYYYGRIEDLFYNGIIENLNGSIPIKGFPASAAGPDIRQFILGSEGRLGIITKANMRIRKLPEKEVFYGVLFKNWKLGENAVRTAVQQDLQVSMMRLSDSTETLVNFKLSGENKFVNIAEKYLPKLGFSSNRCMLIFGVTGKKKKVNQTIKEARSIFNTFKSSPLIKYIGKSWNKNRFLIPYIRNSLWDAGFGLDTIETSIQWDKVNFMSEELKKTISVTFEGLGERVLVFSHLSHIYKEGASIYVTYIFRRKSNPDELLIIWETVKKAVSKKIVEVGGTISHQHGIGVDHKPFVHFEKGKLGLDAISSVINTFDPNGMFNPGKLID